MIRVTLSNVAYDNRVVLEDNGHKGVTVQVEGHAGAGVRGSDPLCAAVSALAGTLVISVSRTAGIPQKIEQEKGFLRTEISTEKASPEQIRTLISLLDFFLIGIFEAKKTEEGRLTVLFNP